RKQIANLLIKALFRGPYVADAFQQLIEVIPAARVFQALIIHHEALTQKLLEMGTGPLAKLHATGRTHTVADSQNQIEVVITDLSLDLTPPFRLNCQGFLDSCLQG